MRTQPVPPQPHARIPGAANVIGALIGGLASGAGLAFLLWHLV